MHAVHVVLWVIACVLAALATANVGTRINLVAAALLAAFLNLTIDVLRH